MTTPPRYYRTTFEEAQRSWPGFTANIEPTTPKGTKLNWYYQLGYGVLSFAALRRLGKKPRTRARNLLKRTSDLWVVGKVGGSEVVVFRVVSETQWRGGILDLVPDEVVDTLASQIGEG